MPLHVCSANTVRSAECVCATGVNTSRCVFSGMCVLFAQVFERAKALRPAGFTIVRSPGPYLHIHTCCCPSPNTLFCSLAAINGSVKGN